MKKLLSLMLSTVLLLTAVSALAETAPLTLKVGELTYLNSDSTSRTELLDQVRGIAVQHGAGSLFGNADALEMVEFDINMLRAMRQAPETNNYGRSAMSVGETLGSVRGFDAKQ